MTRGAGGVVVVVAEVVVPFATVRGGGLGGFITNLDTSWCSGSSYLDVDVEPLECRECGFEPTQTDKKKNQSAYIYINTLFAKTF